MKAGPDGVHSRYLLLDNKRMPSFFPVYGMIVLSRQGRVCMYICMEIYVTKLGYFNLSYFIVH